MMQGVTELPLPHWAEWQVSKPPAGHAWADSDHHPEASSPTGIMAPSPSTTGMGTPGSSQSHGAARMLCSSPPPLLPSMAPALTCRSPVLHLGPSQAAPSRARPLLGEPPMAARADTAFFVSGDGADDQELALMRSFSMPSIGRPAAVAPAGGGGAGRITPGSEAAGAGEHTSQDSSGTPLAEDGRRSCSVDDLGGSPSAASAEGSFVDGEAVLEASSAKDAQAANLLQILAESRMQTCPSRKRHKKPVASC